MGWFSKRKYLPQSPLVREAHSPKLSFCISHKNRIDSLKATLPQNLTDNAAQANEIEFVLVDFGSDEDITPWILENFRPQLQSGYLRVHRAEGLADWHASIAKNTTHSLADGAILVNLDSDNFTGNSGAAFVIENFQRHSENIVLWQYSKKKLDGTFGRLAISRDLFQRIGGYDESLLPMGYQDGDLKDRALAMGARLVHDTNPLYNRAIKNEKFRPVGMTWKQMNEHNEKLSRANVRAGILVANGGVIGLQTHVFRLDPSTETYIQLR